MTNEKDIRHYTLEELKKLPSETDWAKVEGMTQEKLAQLIAEDPDERDLRPDWTKATLVIPKSKQAISIRLDADVLEWFKQQGRGYQKKIQAVLRTYMDAHRNTKDSHE